MTRHAVDLPSLRAGSLHAYLDGTDLRYVRWDGEEVLQRVYLAVRDPNWVTLVPEVLTVEEPVTGELSIRWRAEYRVGESSLHIKASIEANDDRLCCSMTATAVGHFTYNRVGWCLLLPLTLAGSRVSHTAENGRVIAEKLPRLVAPQLLGSAGPKPAMGPFTSFGISGTGARYELAMTGDLFELEDQRNWTDASFKIYSTPLALPRPRQLRNGETISQDVVIARAPERRARPMRKAQTTRPALTPTTVSALLSEATDADLLALRGAGVSHLRVELCPAEPGAMDEAGQRLAQAARAGMRSELTLWCDQATPWGQVQRFVAEHEPDLVLVLPAGAVAGSRNECTSRDLFAIATRELPSSMLAGGTAFNLCELQRHELTHLGVLSCTLTPTVHAVDPLSVRETPGSLPALVQTLRARAPEAALALGPFQGRERKSGDPARLRPSVAGLPADWLATAVATLLQAGVERLCVADVGDLARDGVLTEHGQGIALMISRAKTVS